jgi:predicted ester cyclase
MSTKENKELLGRAYTLMNQKRLDSFFKLLAPDYIEHWTENDLSLEQAKEADTLFFKAFPDATATIEELVAEGDKVAIRVTWRGTHKGDFRGLAPTGKKAEMTNTGIYRIAKGKLAECWATVDSLRLMQQLGVIPRQ